MVTFQIEEMATFNNQSLRVFILHSVCILLFFTASSRHSFKTGIRQIRC